MMEKVDLDRAKQIMRDVAEGKIKVSVYISYEKPTPLAYHILAQYADVTEMMAPERVIVNNIEKMKMAIDARTTALTCMKCGQWTRQEKIKDCPCSPNAPNAVQGFLAPLYRSQDVNHLRDALAGEGKAKS